jgi:hypothetical protein
METLNYLKIVFLAFTISLWQTGFSQNFCIGLGEPGLSNYSHDIRQCDGGYLLAGASGSGNGNALLIKISEAGKVLWKKNFGGEGLETGYRVAVVPDGFILLCRFQPDTGGSFGSWILKTDTSGNPVWNKYIVAEQWEIPEGLTALSDSGFVLLSTRYNTSRDVILRRFNAAGDVIWEKGLIRPADERGVDLLLAKNGNLYVAGEVENGQTDILFAAFNLNGDSLFSKISGSIYNDNCSGITEHSSGKLAISGTTYPGDGTGKLLLLRFTEEGTEDLKIVQLGDLDFKIGRIAWNDTNLYFIPFTLKLENNANLTGYYEFDENMNFQCSVKLEGQPASYSSAMIAGRNNTALMTGETENPVPSLPQIYVIKAGTGCVSPPITLSLNKQISAATVNLYPHPADAELNIQLPENTSIGDVKISMSTISGSIFFPSWIKNEQGIKVFTDALPPSVYLLKIETVATVYHAKILISR